MYKHRQKNRKTEREGDRDRQGEKEKGDHTYIEGGRDYTGIRISDN
jgi:hypothetical protein